MNEEIKNKREILINNSEENIRADIFISKKLNLTRNFVQKLISEGRVKINNKIISKKSENVSKGDIVEVEIPEEEKFFLTKSEKKFDVIWEDENILVINKPAGYIVHPSSSEYKNTIVNMILEEIDFGVESEAKKDDLIKGKIRPGIVHRLDKDVSGVLVIAKNQKTLAYLSELFKERKVKKRYVALCFGYTTKDMWMINQKIARARGEKIMRVGEEGKEAITFVKKLRDRKDLSLSLFEVFPITGRTHQIRVHLSSNGFPIVKDEMYGGGGKKLQTLKKKLGEELFDFQGIFLHSLSIEIEGQTFFAPLPHYFQKIIQALWQEIPPTLCEAQKS